MNYRIRDVVEVAHGKWKEKYLVTSVGPGHSVMLKKIKLGKTKISAIRFPETITLTLYANVLEQ